MWREGESIRWITPSGTIRTGTVQSWAPSPTHPDSHRHRLARGHAVWVTPDRPRLGENDQVYVRWLEASNRYPCVGPHQTAADLERSTARYHRELTRVLLEMHGLPGLAAIWAESA